MCVMSDAMNCVARQDSLMNYIRMARTRKDRYRPEPQQSLQLLYTSSGIGCGSR